MIASSRIGCLPEGRPGTTNQAYDTIPKIAVLHLADFFLLPAVPAQAIG
jgi:hypothetical protein